jgi:hypothetical protein
MIALNHTATYLTWPTMPALNLSVCAFGGISANLTDKKDSEINRQPTTASACEVELIR